jgi:crotonobetainyl-CoA:carnitine CoA-transferase CaiB-like acyl-CoA transferase
MPDDQPPPASRPLEGLKVIDLATFIAAPFTAATLGEFGADVIKVEQPGSGDPMRVFGSMTSNGDTLNWLNEGRNKRSVTLDLRHPKGAVLFRQLAAKTDVVCENFRPGTLDKWGLGYPVLSANNRGLILLQVSGFGQTGPYRTLPGFARIAHAVGGLSYLAAEPGGRPIVPGSTSLADYISGLYGVIGVMLALKHRDQTGEGQVIDVALYESIFRVLDEIAPAYAMFGKVRQPMGSAAPNVCPHSHYRTADDNWVAIACTSDKMFERLARVMGQPELASPEKWGKASARTADNKAVDATVEAWTKSLALAEILKLAHAGEVPCGPINSIEDIFKDPQFIARNVLETVEVPELGPVTVPAPLPRLSRSPGKIDHLGTPLGSANEDIYCGLLGLSTDELRILAAEGVI